MNTEVKVYWVPRIADADRPEYCPCVDEQTHPVCPACPATVAGNDPVHGVCQAKRSGPPPRPLIELVLIHRGEA